MYRKLKNGILMQRERFSPSKQGGRGYERFQTGVVITISKGTPLPRAGRTELHRLLNILSLITKNQFFFYIKGARPQRENDAGCKYIKITINTTKTSTV